MLIDKALKDLNDKSVDLITYILQHTNYKTHIFTRTYRQMQKDVGVSQPTIARVMKKFVETGAAEYLGGSSWKINVITGTSDSYEGPEWYVTNLGP